MRFLFAWLMKNEKHWRIFGELASFGYIKIRKTCN